MALQLEEFLHTDLPVRKGEIQQIGEMAATVLASFHLAFKTDRKEWPYRIDDDGIKVNGNFLFGDTYSFSTNSMVLFALKALLGKFEDRVKPNGGKVPPLNWANGNVALLTPMLAKANRNLQSLADIDPSDQEKEWDDLCDKLSSCVLDTAERLKREVDAHKTEKPGELTGSGTFGPNDPFSLCWLLESFSTEEIGPWITVALARSKQAVVSPREFSIGTRGNPAPSHVLSLLRALQAYKRLKQLGQLELVEETSFAAIKGWFESRVHEHLSYANIPDSSFDAPELLFALEGLLVCEPQSLGIERLVRRVFEVIQEKQQHNPNLRPYRPILSDERGRALLPLTIEVFGTLLRIFERLASDNSYVITFKQVHGILKRYAEWLLGQRCTIRVEGKNISGWSSEHTNTRNCIHVWETSQVLLFLVHYLALLRDGLQRDILEAGNFTVQRPTPKNYMPQREQDYAAKELHKKTELYRKIWDNFISPRVGVEPASRAERFSMLLYGPPGTGKNTLAEHVAGMLGWDLITLGMSDFVERGDQGVEARAKAIFDALQQLSDKVILFDEIDRLLLDRDSPEYFDEETMFQVMVASMLLKLRLLRRREKCIFIITTNYEDRIDRAAKRAERIDLSIIVPPPDKACRERFLKEQLGLLKLETNEGLLIEAVKASRLFTFPELNVAVRETFFKEKRGGDEVLRAFIKYVKERDPEINLNAYEPRFADVNGKRRSQVPAIEFTTLCGIVEEVSAPLDRSVQDLLAKAQKWLPAGAKEENSRDD